MYLTLIVVLLASAAAISLNGLRKRNYFMIGAGVLSAVAVIVFFSLLNFWAEMLWFESVGYPDRFWKVIFSKAGFAVAGGLAGFAAVWLLAGSIGKEKIIIRLAGAGIGAYLGGAIGYANWDTILLFLNQATTELKDPVIGKKIGFYMFSLGFYDAVYGFLLTAGIIAFAASAIAVFVYFGRNGEVGFETHYADNSKKDGYRGVYFCGGFILLVLAMGMFLNRYHLMYSDLGAVTGAGWTDVNVRLPAYWVMFTVLCVLGFVFLIVPSEWWVNKFEDKSGRYVPPGIVHISVLLLTAGTAAVFWVVSLGVVPSMLQWLRVEPNEITFEKPYIKNNIEFTLYGFGLDNVEEREFAAKEELTASMVEQNSEMFNNIRLWDWRALDSVYKQFQEIRLYYEFSDVDIDRYVIDDDYRQVMVSAREMKLSNLPPQSQTFVNKRFKYTHGYGLTLTTVSEFTEEGLPNLLVRDIPPRSKYESLNVDRPQIYYGELTDTHVVVNTKEPEFDYPKGQENEYINYPGKGGVEISSLWRKFLFGWKFDGTRLFLSSYPKKDSRIMFYREIIPRINRIAPFLKYDDDPYVALVDGKIFWIVDAYTTSERYPYSEKFYSGSGFRFKSQGRAMGSSYLSAKFDGINYVRNSVKIVVDAFEGSVKFYVFDSDDPVIQTWSNIFGGLFLDRADMPEEFERHVRYPADMLLIQGLVYAKYHMTDPAVFYNQEDLWVRATENYYGTVQPVEPYYIIWQRPESKRSEFVLMLPFTPKNRQVLISWIAGMCDGENYGRFLAYKFPKEKRVLGTQQMETKIDQDSFLSSQLSLWDQRGSSVIRGNVLVIPVEETILYVEPIYLRAETAAYPELRLVAVMHNDRLSYAESFSEALEGLLGKDSGKKFSIDKSMLTEQSGTDAGDTQVQSAAVQANRAFENYLKYLGEKRYREAADELDKLEEVLKSMLKDQ